MIRACVYALPIAAALLAGISTVSASDGGSLSAAATDLSSQARKATVKRSAKARPVRVASGSTLSLPNCFFVFCAGRPILLGTTY